MADASKAPDVSDTYDRESDTYYVSLNTGEPSYCVEVDDVVLLELGLFTSLLTGLRILNMSKRTSSVFAEHYKPKIAQIMKAIEEQEHHPSPQERRDAVRQALEKLLVPA